MRLREIAWVLLVLALQLPLASRCAFCQWEHVGPDSCFARCAIFRAGDADTAYAVLDYTQEYGVYESIDGGVTWNRTAATYPELVTLGVDPVNKSNIYLVCQTKIYKSMDGGNTWQEKDKGLTLDIGDQYLHDIAVNPCHPDTVYVSFTDFGSQGHELLWRTANGGGRWSLTGMQGALAVAIDPQNCGRMYTATGGTYPKIWRSLNSAATSESVLYQYADDIAVDPVAPDTIYLVHGFTVYRSYDGGSTWTSFGQEVGLSGSVRCLAVNTINTQVVYAAGEGGVFRSTDGGTTWSSFEDGLPPSVDVYSIAVDGETGQTILVGTYNYGIFRRTESLANVGPPPSNRETNALALQVSPNPFRGQTGIYCRLPTPAFAALDVYDVTGRLVNRLASGHRPAGLSATTWNGKDALGSIVAPGIYFLELTTTADRKTSTVVLLK